MDVCWYLLSGYAHAIDWTVGMLFTDPESEAWHTSISQGFGFDKIKNGSIEPSPSKI